MVKLLVAAVVLAALCVASDAKIKTLVTFGTVLSDSGLPFGLWSFMNNTAPAQKCGFWQGRATNGPVWHEYVTTKFGIQDISFAAGASTVNTVGVKEPITLDGQVAEFVKYMNATGAPLNKPAILFEMGQHDIFDSFFYINGTGQCDTQCVNRFLDNITNVIAARAQDMIDVGYKTIIISNEAALYLFPNVAIAMGGALAPPMRAKVAYVNGNISAAVARLSAANPTAKVLLFDLFSASVDITTKPSKFGLKNATVGCMNSYPANFQDPTCGLIDICKRPSKSVYWDAAHFSTDAMRAIGQKLTNLLKREKLV